MQWSAAPLYRRLPRGPHSLDRESVLRHQRLRLHGAMIEAVAERGYESTAVADVLALAGVSRRAFYEQFSNKQECFLATCDAVIARARKTVLDAWSTERDWSDRMRAACVALMGDMAAHPKGARLALVDGLGIGQTARDWLQLVTDRFERMIEVSLTVGSDEALVSPLVPRAIVSGSRQIVCTYLRERREHELPALTEPLLEWIDCYRCKSPLAIGFSETAPKSRPANLREASGGPGAAPMAPFLCAEDDSSRILRAFVVLTLEHGYAELSDPQIAQLAGISTEAFHRRFSNKEGCFLGAIDEFAREAQEAVASAMPGAPSWPAAVHRGISALVTHFASDPALSRIQFVDLFSAGAPIVDRMTDSIGLVIETLEHDGPRPLHGADLTHEAIVGVVWGVMSSCVTSIRAGHVSRLADHLSFLVLAPYLGPRAAVEAVGRASASQSSVARRHRAIPSA
jgi:AcrR family transcriptional regulator